ncbi:TonB-dependent receptor [Olivibacter sp. CPCC 100613]|uniref:SusC/RagA family TonB-linked outer membrane protein n=1 Tax=Olivibacter sp. CPCC 100613 TaxID=3079931 RepID=UPI002FF5060C
MSNSVMYQLLYESYRLKGRLTVYKPIPVFWCMVLLVLLLAAKGTVAQQKALINSKLSGRVIDANNKEPLPGALVKIEAVTNQTQTDGDGNFQLVTGQIFPYNIMVSYLGYISKTLAVNGSPVTIELTPSLNQLEDVVVVGYGEQRKADLVGSVAKVDPSAIKRIPEASFDTQLQGNVAGVQINGGTGIPGSNTFIRVRGATSINSSNDPLYIIDGVFVNNTSLQNIAADRSISPMADINPNDIETIEVLKDAAAIAIYGSRGANGVIIITTKRGNFDEKPKIDLDVSQGVGWAPKKWELTSGPEHAMLVEEYRANEGLAPVFTVDGRGLPENQPTYDRQAILNRTARYQNYNLSIRGGSKNTSYYIGGGFAGQEGIWKTMAFNRGSFKVNIDQKISDKVRVGTSNTLTRSYRQIGRAVGSGGTGALYQASIDIPTYLPIFDDEGKPLRWVNFDNIHSLVTESDNKAYGNHYIGSIYAEIDFLPNLKFRSSFSLDYNLYEEKEYWNTQLLRGIANNGEATNSLTQSDFWINEQTLRYTKSFNNAHNVGILVGTHIQRSKLSNNTSRGTNFPNDSFKLISAAANQTASETWGENTLLSFFSRLEYSYKNRYLLEATIRADGSSKFSPDNRWGYFPAIGGAWKISEEAFLKDNPVWSNLKLRVNYGVAGNQNGINDFAYRGLWTAGAGYPDTGTSELPGIAPLQLANPDLRWEKTSQFNIGIDLGFLQNRIAIEANYYDKYTTDALLEVSVPNYSGFSSYLSNFGEISNKGFEFSVTSFNVQNENFSWSTAFNIAQNKNKIEVLPNPMSFEDRQFLRIEQGVPLYSYWLYNSLGVDPQTGDLILEDVNQDGQITASDRKVVGDAWPNFFGGLTNNFSYKGFDLNFLFTYSFGNHLWNHNRMLGEQGGRLDANRVIFASQLDRWQQPGDITDVPRLALRNYDKQEVSRFFEDASFVRLRNLSLGYTLPKTLSGKWKIERLRLYATATNLLTFTGYTGADPETRIERGENQNIQGYDFASPPTPRTLQFGIDLTL